MKPVILTDRHPNGPQDQKTRDRLDIRIYFPKPDGKKAINGKITLTNGKRPLVAVRAPAPILVITEEG